MLELLNTIHFVVCENICKILLLGYKHIISGMSDFHTQEKVQTTKLVRYKLKFQFI